MSEQAIRSGEQHYAAHDVTVRWEVYSHRLDFTAREGTQQDDGSCSYAYFDQAGVQHFTDDFALGEQFVSGTIKWDGCSHLNFGVDNGYLHLCGGRHVATLAALLVHMYRLAASEVPGFDAACAELKALTYLPSLTVETTSETDTNE